MAPSFTFAAQPCDAKRRGETSAISVLALFRFVPQASAMPGNTTTCQDTSRSSSELLKRAFPQAYTQGWAVRTRHRPLGDSASETKVGPPGDRERTARCPRFSESARDSLPLCGDELRNLAPSVVESGFSTGDFWYRPDLLRQRAPLRGRGPPN
jgi:hypothetical protein